MMKHVVATRFGNALFEILNNDLIVENTMDSLKKRGSDIVLKIKERRLLLNYSQEYVGYKLGISQNSYSKIEIGKSKLTVDSLFLICDALNIEIASLLKK